MGECPEQIHRRRWRTSPAEIWMCGEAAEWLRCLAGVSAAETTQTSEVNQFPPRQQKRLTPSVLVTHSSCSANYCSLHPSENHIKLLGKLFYAIGSWNTQEAPVSVCCRNSSCIMDGTQQISVLERFVYVLDGVWVKIDTVAIVASAAAVSSLSRQFCPLIMNSLISTI